MATPKTSEERIERAVKVLKCQKGPGSVQQKIAFLRMKGCTDAEIAQALNTATNGALVKAAVDAGLYVPPPPAPKPADIRLFMIKQGLELEMLGMRLTNKTPPCFTIIRREFGIVTKREPDGKRKAYEAFCSRYGFTPKDKPS